MTKATTHLKDTTGRNGQKYVLHRYIKNNPSQRDYKKRMIEIWVESTRFITRSQMLANHTRMILKKVFFFLEKLEICKQISYEEYEVDPPIRTEKLNTEK